MTMNEFMELAVEKLPPDVVMSVDKNFFAHIPKENRDDHISLEALAYMVSTITAEAMIRMRKSACEDTFGWLNYLLESNKKDFPEDLVKACEMSLKVLKKSVEVAPMIEIGVSAFLAGMKAAESNYTMNVKEGPTCPACGEKHEGTCTTCTN